MIGVIDYKAGNGPSVYNALQHIGIPCFMAGTPEEILRADGLILPGVGAAEATMESLQEKGILSAIEKRVLEDKVPFLGICVGLQVLFEHSEEGDTPCLGWLKGKVKRFNEGQRVPQIGWNKVKFVREHPLIKGCGTSDYFYFVNSYYVEPEEEVALGMTEYGKTFCSFVAKENIMAAQFHAEKSGESGLNLLRNFAEIVKGEGLC